MNVLIDLAIYFVNGLLVTAYLIADHAAQLTAIAAAVVLAVSFDRLAQREATFAPARYHGAAPTRVPRTAQVFTAITLGLWLASTAWLGPPVPLIGAVLWSLALLALLTMPNQRYQLLWQTKAGLVVYCLAIFAYRFGAWQLAQLTPAALSALFGGPTAAEAVLTQNAGTFLTIGAWLLWVILPLGYGALLVQHWAAQPMSLVAPWQGAQDVITQLRSREPGA